MTFDLHSFRFAFRARDSIHFPPGKPGNILRGALGTIFRRIACVPQCTDVKTCDLRESCPYARLFEPGAIKPGPSGLADWPRPFVFRASHLDGCTIPPGARFHFDLNVFEMRDPALPYFVLTFAQLGREGLGPGRGRADLESVHTLDERRQAAVQVFDGSSFLLSQPPAPLSLELANGTGGAGKVVVRFLTPTELKFAHERAGRPEFPILFGRIRDRLSTLRALYGAGPLDIDFRAMGGRAAAVRMTRCDIQQREVWRRSSKTRQEHPIGGFVGEAEYEGDLSEFLPYLRAAEWTGVGRQTVWGKGEIQVNCAPLEQGPAPDPQRAADVEAIL